MSDKTGHDEKSSRSATTIHASKGGGGGKWLLAGLAAVVLAGGGYYAWTNYGESQTQAQTAYNDPYTSQDPISTAPLAPDQATTAQTAASDASGDEVNATPAATSATTPARRTSVATPVIAEETIGVTPMSAATEDDVTNSDEIVVTGQRQATWVRRPSARRLAALYPQRALERGREGEAMLRCTVLDGGSLNCVRASETPGGFGGAAMRVASTLRHAPVLADGSDAAGSQVNLHVVFRMSEETRRG